MEWISVKERLPEKEQDVLFFDRGKVYSGYYYFEKFCPYPCDDCFKSKQSKVTHWIPWPKAPKE